MAAIKTVYKVDSVLHPTIAKKVLHQILSLKDGQLGKRSHDVLSDREFHVLRLTASDLNNNAMAQELNVSRSTIQNHLRSIFNKLVVDLRIETITVAMKKTC